MKRLILFVLLASLVLNLSSCSFREREETEPGFVIQSSDSTKEPTISQTEGETTATESATVPTEFPEETFPHREPDDEDFVRVIDYIPDIWIDLRYATEQNFTGQRIYDFNELWLRYGTVKKLMLVQDELKQYGLYLKVWDGFRPPAAQFKLWEVCPNPVYVANPNNRFSSHSRGNTVDLTIVYADGTEVVMPTDFDDFSKMADRNYSDCSEEAAENACMLEQIMIAYGFKAYSGEWWHFTDTKSYPVEEWFEPAEELWYYAHCNEYISLRTEPDTGSVAITRIPANEKFQRLAVYGDFSLVRYDGLIGYVLTEYIRAVE